MVHLRASAPLAGGAAGVYQHLCWPFSHPFPGCCPLLLLQSYRPGMLYSDIEMDAPRHKHFSDRGAAGPRGGGAPLPPPAADLPAHAGLGMGPSVGVAMFMGLGGPAPTPVDDGSFSGVLAHWGWLSWLGGGRRWHLRLGRARQCVGLERLGRVRGWKLACR